MKDYSKVGDCWARLPNNLPNLIYFSDPSVNALGRLLDLNLSGVPLCTKKTDYFFGFLQLNDTFGFAKEDSFLVAIQLPA